MFGTLEDFAGKKKHVLLSSGFFYVHFKIDDCLAFLLGYSLCIQIEVDTLPFSLSEYVQRECT